MLSSIRDSGGVCFGWHLELRFTFEHGWAKCSRARKNIGTIDKFCAMEMWFSFGAVLNSIGHCGVRLIESSKGDHLRDGKRRLVRRVVTGQSRHRRG